MRGRIVFILSLLLLLLFIGAPAYTSPSSYQVLVVPVKGEIEPGWLLFLERSLQEAEDENVDAVVLDMDTPGGYVDTALEARQLINNFPKPIYVYVNSNALSAGAFLALAADGYYMVPGATIGAAEPRILGQQTLPDEKFLSFWEAEMRGAAENNERDPRLASAMVRREIVVEGVLSEGELLTLTAGEADELDFSDGTTDSLEELLSSAGLEGAEIIRTDPTAWESLSGWLINPTVATIILSMAFLFLILEVLSAGFGVAGLLSILCFGLYFGGHFFTGVSGWVTIFLFLFGVILLLVEAFAPGFGVFGLGGLVAVSASIILSAATAAMGLRMLLISFLVSGLAGYAAFKYFQRRGTLRRFILFDSATRELGYSSFKDLSTLKDKIGRTVTPLRPSGIVEIEDSRYDTVSEGSFIDADSAVRVVKVEGMRVVVRPLSEENREENTSDNSALKKKEET